MTDPASGDFYLQYADGADTNSSSPGTRPAWRSDTNSGAGRCSERMSMLDIIENHSRLVQSSRSTPPDTAAALQFLLQTLAAFDVATRGFLDGTRRYEQQRARAEDLADRDEIRECAGELAAGRLLRRRSHRRDRRDQRRVLRDHRLWPCRAAVPARHTRGCRQRFRGQREAVCAQSGRQDHRRDVDPAPRRIRFDGWRSASTP